MHRNLLYPIGFISYNKPTPLPRKKKPEIQKCAEPSDDGQSIYSDNSYEDIVVTGPEDNIPQNIVNTETREPAITENRSASGEIETVPVNERVQNLLIQRKLMKMMLMYLEDHLG